MVGEWARVISPRPCNHLPVVLGGYLTLHAAHLQVCPVEQDVGKALAPLLPVCGDDVGAEADTALHILQSHGHRLTLLCLLVPLVHRRAVDGLPDAHTLEELLMVLLCDLAHVYGHRQPDEGFGDYPRRTFYGDLFVVLNFADVPV